MATLAPRRMTLAEFLNWDDGSDRRYELLDGFPVMMAPATETHGELVAALGAEIRSRLAPPCRVISEAAIVIPDRADTYYIADLAVTCVPREPDRRMVAEPVLIIEVLSSSTSQVDRWRKVADYRALRSVQEILVAFADEQRVELQRRGADEWRIEDLTGAAEFDLFCCQSLLRLNAIYCDIVEEARKPVDRAPTSKSMPLEQDFDKNPSIMFLQSSHDYILSSQHLNEDHNKLDMYFNMPPFFLCSHAFELLLKAFLRSRGWSVEKLAKKVGHDLTKLYQAAKESGLQNKLDNSEWAQLELLASLGIGPHFHSRYTGIGGLATPSLPTLYQIYSRLEAEIGPVVEADFERWRRGIIGDSG